ncbi:sigma-70 family RNA polymerase sigma factor [Leptolyngbya sp. NK1-12]|uniref:Sigma-70 family RNA polymerase sigma factor n=1 Tax=Leptolyngbya sp. NK1-12 TaxID=2547451 RepID=A0AA96WQN3_9CYAN|nr:sigma-70 family RNA polymerase sigma factor [Leptolyngbya sp. NK1-12]WNZ27251.1 sigma-70 family RNA polymerase sigma factor [Leptolyngbya sp. NK1-12]
MRPRQELSELFSTFIQFENDYFKTWSTDPTLRRSIRSRLEQLPDVPQSDKFWALYWYRVWQTQSFSQMAAMHLSAYLQEPCYWTVKRTLTKFTSTQSRFSDSFQTVIAEIHQVLRRYDPNKYSDFKLYASLVFSTILRDTLRQRQEVDLCTNWTLLRKVGRKRFVDTLQNLGLSASNIAQYQLAWVCFKELYAHNSFASEPKQPNQALWAAVANLYNTERQHQLASAGSPVSPESIQQWLTDCANSIRAYLYPSIGSLNVIKTGQEAGEVQDDLPNPLSDSLLSELIAQEDAQARQTQQAQVSTVLSGALQQFDWQSQQLLHLYYGQNLNQMQMAKQTGLSQATVSRRLTQTKKDLLKILVQWSQDTLNISPTSTSVIDMGAALEDWLTIRYSESDLASAIDS